MPCTRMTEFTASLLCTKVPSPQWQVDIPRHGESQPSCPSISVRVWPNASGQLINVWNGGLPVVVLTFHGDTGSFADRVALDISHNAGPTLISAPFTKANWTVIEPEGLPSAIERAIMVATTPPMGPVHLAVYDRMLGNEEVTTGLIDGATRDVRAGYPSEDDLEALARGLHEAERPLIYIGDGVWKSGGEAP